MDVPILFKNINLKMSIPSLSELQSGYPGGNVQSYILKNKVWAEDETTVMATILQNQKGLVIDVGANTGYFSLIGLSFGCPVIAFEPNKVHTPFFQRSLELNNFTSLDFTHYELLVTNSEKDTLFDGWSAKTELMTKNQDLQLVKTVALDNICEQCLFLKIDVEGFEPDVIKSSQKLLTNHKIPYIMLEVTYIINNVIDNEQVKMLTDLISYGFDLYEIQPKRLLRIENVNEKVRVWSYEYFNHHKKHTPSITSGGSNLLAIHKTAKNPFIKIHNTLNYSL